MKRHWQRWRMAFAGAAIALTVAFGIFSLANQGPSGGQAGESDYNLYGNKIAESNRLPNEVRRLDIPSITDADGAQYLQLFTLMDELGYNRKYVKEQDVYQFGFLDPEFLYQPDVRQITTFDVPRITENVLYHNGQPYLAASSVRKLLQFVHPADIETWDEEDVDYLIQREAENAQTLDRDTDNSAIAGRDDELAIAGHFNADAMIARARRHLGTPYVFGAPVGTTRIFDCSTFTKHVFAESGIWLPRTSRMQGKMGKRVSVRDLQKGDLLFFYYPGRYRSNRIVGHVGIYMGNGRMIHSFPPDVSIVSLREPKLRKTFLFAKRVR